MHEYNASFNRACVAGYTLTFELQQPLSETDQKFVYSDELVCSINDSKNGKIGGDDP